VADGHDRSIEDLLRDLKDLHDEGLITDYEYGLKRARIIVQIGSPPPVVVPAQPSPEPQTVVVKQSSGCATGCLIVLVLGVVGIWAVMSFTSSVLDSTNQTFANVAEDLDGQSSRTTKAPAISSSSLEYKMAVVDGNNAPSASVIARYERALRKATGNCRNTKQQIADMSVVSTQILAEEGIRATTLEMVEAVNVSLTDLAETTDCTDVFALLVSLMVNGG
jgi:hypothetical protein